MWGVRDVLVGFAISKNRTGILVSKFNKEESRQNNASSIVKVKSIFLSKELHPSSPAQCDSNVPADSVPHIPKSV